MWKRVRYFLAGSLLFFVIYGGLWLLGFFLEKTFESDFKGSTITILANTDSPDQKYMATTYLDSGGGAAGWCGKKVGLRKSEELFDPKKSSVFTAGCQSDVAVYWKAVDILLIEYSTDGISASLYEKSLSDDKAVRILYQTK